MKRIITYLLSLLVTTNLFAGKYTINEAWKFTLEPISNAHLTNCNDLSWQTISFPHTWNNMDAIDDVPGYYRGKGWYRKSLFIGKENQGKVVQIYFEGANQVVELYVNGKLAGTHKGGYTRFTFDITSYIEYDKNNLIAISVDNSYDASIPPLSADFTFFGGIYRDVYLVIKDKLHLSNQDNASSGVYIKTPEVNKEKGEIEIKTLLNNGYDIRKNVLLEYILTDPQGNEVIKKKQKQTIAPLSINNEVNEKVTVINPQLWSPATPNLYRLHTSVYDAKTKERLDEYSTSIGFRWFHFDGEKGFFLNGEHLKLIGTNRHQCYYHQGNALKDEYHIRDIRLLKEMGGNFIRISHYPQDPLILEMCDKLGILASVEVPIINAITETEAFFTNATNMAEEMVKQNFNHPSLIIWAYMNEIMLRPPFADNVERHTLYCKEVNKLARQIENRIRELDPYRYTMQAFHGSMTRYGENEADLMHVSKIIGWNLYNGWYGGQFSGFDAFLDKFHQKYPDTPILITEYGADVDVRLHSFDSERFDFSVEYADRYHEHYLKTIMKNDFIAGATIWNLNDFHSESRTDAVPHINSKGITTTTRELKNTYLLYKTRFNPIPSISIGTKTWKKRGGIDNGNGICIQPVKVYSNQPKADIFHNGKLLESITFTDNVATVQIPFTKGRNLIEANAYSNSLTDFCEIDFDLIPNQPNRDNFEEVNIMLGSKRYFEDRDANLIWVPEKEYTPGSWGYIGGHAYRPQTRHGSLPAADVDIAETNQDPLFQTQRVDLNAFKLDVPDGKYVVYLYWAELLTRSKKEVLPYNLGNDVEQVDIEQSVFDVLINSKPVLMNYDILAQAGNGRAVIKKFLIETSSGQGINIQLQPVKGHTILNAIRVVKIN